MNEIGISLMNHKRMQSHAFWKKKKQKNMVLRLKKKSFLIHISYFYLFITSIFKFFSENVDVIFKLITKRKKVDSNLYTYSFSRSKIIMYNTT